MRVSETTGNVRGVTAVLRLICLYKYSNRDEGFDARLVNPKSLLPCYVLIPGVAVELKVIPGGRAVHVVQEGVCIVVRSTPE